MQRQRPTLLTVLAILALIFGIFGICAGFAAFGVGSLGAVVGGTTGSAEATTAGGTLFIVGAIALIGGLLDVLFGIGTLMDKSWAWLLGVIGLGLGIVSNIVSIVFDAMNGKLGAGLASPIIGIIIAGAILYYLNTAPVKAYFGRA